MRDRNYYFSIVNYVNSRTITTNHDERYILLDKH